MASEWANERAAKILGRHAPAPMTPLLLNIADALDAAKDAGRAESPLPAEPSEEVIDAMVEAYLNAVATGDLDTADDHDGMRAAYCVLLGEDGK